MSSWVKSLIVGIILIAFLYIVNAMLSSSGFFGIGVDDYQGRLLAFIAINIILATSLNLINGFTGQFSIGHAGFMAVGAYSTAFSSTQLAPGIAAVFAPGGAAGGASP